MIEQSYLLTEADTQILSELADSGNIQTHILAELAL